jgi:hypothetical protein
MRKFNIILYEWLTFNCVSVAYDAACTVVQVVQLCISWL